MADWVMRILPVVAVVALARPAHAEGPVAAPPLPCREASVAQGSAPDLTAEERVFDREMELFARRWEFTRRLVEEREARAFEEEQIRYARYAELTRKLAEDAELTLEREFDQAVSLYVEKRALTQRLAGDQASASKPPPATPDTR